MNKSPLHKPESCDLVDTLFRLPDAALISGKLSSCFLSLKCESFRSAAQYVKQLPYGRNTKRDDYHLVLVEKRGTCSTKHALLAALGREIHIDIQLMLALYDMSEKNTPGVGTVLSRYGLQSIPEAHCFLRYRGNQFDVTMPTGLQTTVKQFYKERVISPEDIGDIKENFHRQAILHWTSREKHLAFEVAWQARNECIAALSSSNSN